MSVIVVVCMYALPIVVIGYFLYMEIQKIRYSVRKQIKDMHFKESLHSLGSLQGVQSMQGAHAPQGLQAQDLQDGNHTHDASKHHINPSQKSA